MPALTPVPLDLRPFTPDPITDQEAGALLRAALRLFGHWGVNDREAAVLLDVAPRTLARWKAGDQPGRLGRDVKARLSNLMGIHKALRLIFREPARGYAWVRAPNAAFEGRPALEVMLGGELTDLMRVRRVLDAERGGW
ncbi:antitoxin Xre-like helix-turn-helix domain-containing protein [Roseomonas sp. GCM10028921]